MKTATTNGLNPMINPFMPVSMVVRTETTGNHSTLSIADETNGVMLQVVVNDEVKKLLKDIVR